MGKVLWLDNRISLSDQLFDLKEVKNVLWVPITLWGLQILQQIQLLQQGEALLISSQFKQLLRQA